MQNTASILDYPRESLDETIWNISDNQIQLQPNIRDEIEDIILSFFDDLNLPEEALLDVFIYGSILTNQYNPRTDVDARILLDPNVLNENYPELTGDQLYDMTKDIVHGIPLGDTQHPFNATVVIEGEETELGKSDLGISDKDTVYSMKEDNIVHEGTWYDESFDPDEEFAQERDETSTIMEKLDALIRETKTDTIDFQLIEEAVGDVANPDALISKLESKLEELEADVATLTNEYNQLKEDRSTSYKTEAPEDDRHKAPGNVRFKMLERYQYMDVLKKIKSLFKDGLQEDEVSELADVLQLESFKYDIIQGPNVNPYAPPTSPTGPQKAPEMNPNEAPGGGMMHGASCPHCGHNNPMMAKEGDTIECQGCGKHFEAGSGISINTGPGTIMDTAPYDSDVPVWGALEDVDRLQKTLKDMGVADPIVQQVTDRMQKDDPAQTSVELPQAPTAPKAPSVPEAPESQGTPAPKSPTMQKPLSPGKPMKQLVKPQEEPGGTMSTADKKAWFDEPSWTDPGSDPRGDPVGPLADPKGKGKKKDDDELPADDEVMEIITVLDGIDILPFLEDEELIAEILSMFPCLGVPSEQIDAAIKRALNQDPAEGTGQYIAPTTGDAVGIDFIDEHDTKYDNKGEEEEEFEEEEEEETEEEDLEFDADIALAIGHEIGINWEEVKFDPEQLLEGIKVELEHGSHDPETNVTDDDLIETAKIAWAHLKEMADYYTKLKELETSADEEIGDDVESDDVSEGTSEGGSKSFDEGFPGKMARAYITMCPECKSINSADYWETTQCDACHRDSIEGYFWTHLDEEKGNVKEPVPAHLQDQFAQATSLTGSKEINIPAANPKYNVTGGTNGASSTKDSHN